MCNICGHENGTTRHLIYWQAEWAKRFFTTWWHIINRRAYWRWCRKNYKSYQTNKINQMVREIDEICRFELDEILGEKGK